jgi:hypothetical protein
MAHLPNVKNPYGTHDVYGNHSPTGEYINGQHCFYRQDYSSRRYELWYIYYSIEYLNGMKHGIERYYNNIGAVTSEIIYAKGKIHGTARIFAEPGYIDTFQEYSEDRKHGKYYKYSSRNIIQSEGEFFHDVIIWMKTYDNIGVPSSYYTYYNNLVLMYESYHEGRLLSRNKYLNVDTHGKSVHRLDAYYHIKGVLCSEKDFLQYNRDCADVIKRYLDRDTSQLVLMYLNLEFYEQ